MAPEPADLAHKRFSLSIIEVQQQFAFGEIFSGRYSRTLTLSDGSTRTIELTPMTHNGIPVVEFKDSGGLTYMGLNGTTLNGRLMVQLRDVDAAMAAISPVMSPETSLTDHSQFVPSGFTQGIEILNDNATPMEFVTQVLSEHLGLDRPEATRRMLEIHTRGGALIATVSFAEAQRIAAQIAAAARKGGYPLVCRAVSRPLQS
jgi:ATP-dependent Clp protease adapter protein ClpS